MKKKPLLYTTLAFSIVLAIYCAVFFVIPFPKSPTSWSSFGFTVLAICLCGLVCVYAFCGRDMKSKFYGFPVFKVALIYAVVQFLAGIVICMITAFVNISVWIPIVLYAIIFAVGALGFFVTDSAKSVITKIDSETEYATQTIAKLQAEMAGIIDICTDADTRNILKKLEEGFRYSDPVSSPELESIEKDLLAEIGRLHILVKEKHFGKAIKLADTIRINLAERNRMCKLYKK